MESLGPPSSFPATYAALSRSRLAQERRELECEKADLLQRRDLARRRLAAAAGHNVDVWMSSPDEIARVRKRLETPTDETLAEIAKRVGEVKNELTQKALDVYAARCNKNGFPLGK